MLKKISVLGGNDKNGIPETIRRLDIQKEEVLAVVGPTGSGKTQLISDIEQYANADPYLSSILINDLLGKCGRRRTDIPAPCCGSFAEDELYNRFIRRRIYFAAC